MHRKRNSEYKVSKRTYKNLAPYLVIALLVLTVPVGVYLVNKPQRYDSRAEGEQIDELTKELYELEEPKPKEGVEALVNRYFGPTPDEIEEDKLATAIVRHDKLAKMAEDDPEEFIKHADLYTERDKFPEEVKDLIEKPVAARGTVEVTHFDDFENKKAEYKYKLKAEDKKYEILTKQAPSNSSLKPGSEVSVRSVGIDDKIVVAENQGSQVDVISISPTIQQRVIRAAAILYKFQNTQQPNQVTKQSVENILINNENSVKNYFLENSYGKIEMTAVVFDWVTIPENEGGEGCLDDRWSQLAREQLNAQGVDLSTYTNFLYISSADRNPCGIAHADVSGPNSYYPNDYETAWVYEHELGHNLGLEHANSLTCGSRMVDRFLSCRSQEYGDLYDTMGFGYGSHFNAPHKHALGWFNSGQVREITQSGTYRLYPITNGSNSPLTLKIFKPDTGEAYYIEYHQRVGFDALLYGDRFDGASVRLVRNPAAHTYLLDSTPLGETEEENYRFKWGIEDGKTFSDPENGIQIKQTAHTLEDVTLEITVSEPPLENTSIKSWEKARQFLTGILPDKMTKVYRDKLYIYVSDTERRPDDLGYFTLTGEISFADVTDDGLGNLIKAGDLPRNITNIGSLNFSGDWVYVTVEPRGDVSDTTRDGGGGYGVSRIYKARLNSDGTLGTWSDTTQRINAYSESFIYNDSYFYIKQEFDSSVGRIVDNLYRAGFQSDGNFGSWTKLASLPQSDVGYRNLIPHGNRLYAFTWGDRSSAFVGDFTNNGEITNWRRLESLPEIFLGQSDNRMVFARNKAFQFSGYERISVDSADIREDGSFSAWSYTKPIDVEMTFDVTSDNTNIYLVGAQVSRPRFIREFYIGEVGDELNPIQTPSPLPSPRPTPSVFPSPSPFSTPVPTSSPLPRNSIQASCSESDEVYNYNHVDLSYSVDIPNVTIPYGQGVWYTITDNQSGKVIIGSYVGSSNSAQYHDTVTSTRANPSGDYDSIKFLGDGQSVYTVSAYLGYYSDGWPVLDLNNIIFSLSSTPVYCRNASPVPSPSVQPTSSPLPVVSPSPSPSPRVSPSPSPEVSRSPSPSLEPSPSASLEPLPSSSPSPRRIGDIDGDSRVGVLDINIVINFLDTAAAGHPEADLNNDNEIDIIDLGIVIDHFDL